MTVEMIRRLGEEVATQMVDDLPPDQRDAIRASSACEAGFMQPMQVCTEGSISR